MRKRILNILFLLVTASVLFSCQTYKEANTESIIPPVVVDPPTTQITQCKDPRRQACTREYRPVCAIRDTGIRCVTTPCPSTEKVTKPNACSACADAKVTSYTNGACSN